MTYESGQQSVKRETGNSVSAPVSAGDLASSLADMPQRPPMPSTEQYANQYNNQLSSAANAMMANRPQPKNAGNNGGGGGFYSDMPMHGFNGNPSEWLQSPSGKASGGDPWQSQHAPLNNEQIQQMASLLAGQLMASPTNSTQQSSVSSNSNSASTSSSTSASARLFNPNDWQRMFEHAGPKELMEFKRAFCEYAAASHKSSAKINAVNLPGGATFRWYGTRNVPPRENLKIENLSVKVFLGGLSWDLKEEELRDTFTKFGPHQIEWPNKNNKERAHGKGYAYVIFQESGMVYKVLDACSIRQPRYATAYCSDSTNAIPEFYLQIEKRQKTMQIIPWFTTENEYVNMTQSDIASEGLHTAFVGALHGQMTAEMLGKMFNEHFRNSVVAAYLDTDRYKYPIGSGRVVFNNREAFRIAIRIMMVQVHTPLFSKRIQIDPFLEDRLCDNCRKCPGDYFCRSFSCFRYYCPECFYDYHASKNLSTQEWAHHIPVRRQGNKSHSASTSSSVQSSSINSSGVQDLMAESPSAYQGINQMGQFFGKPLHSSTAQSPSNSFSPLDALHFDVKRPHKSTTITQIQSSPLSNALANLLAGNITSSTPISEAMQNMQSPPPLRYDKMRGRRVSGPAGAWPDIWGGERMWGGDRDARHAMGSMSMQTSPLGGANSNPMSSYYSMAALMQQQQHQQQHQQQQAAAAAAAAAQQFGRPTLADETMATAMARMSAGDYGGMYGNPYLTRQLAAGGPMMAGLNPQPWEQQQQHQLQQSRASRVKPTHGPGMGMQMMAPNCPVLPQRSKYHVLMENMANDDDLTNGKNVPNAINFAGLPTTSKK